MADITLHDLPTRLDERIRRLAELQGFTPEAVAAEALAIGMDAYEDRVRKHLLSTREQVALTAAIEEIAKVKDDTFGLIGKVQQNGDGGS